MTLILADHVPSAELRFSSKQAEYLRPTGGDVEFLSVGRENFLTRSAIYWPVFVIW